MRTMWRWISPAAMLTSSRRPHGHFFAANRRAHAISPPPAASRPVLMQIYAGVAELVDALDLGSSDESCGGSSPSARTKRFQRLPTNLGEPFPDQGFGFAELTGAGRKAPRRPKLTRIWPSGRTKAEED